jgi:putative ABC transport system permease protein
MGTETVAFGERRRQVALVGATHEMLEVRRLGIASGRFLPPLEWDRSSPVAVLGQKSAAELFPGRDPVGQIVRVGDWRMRVVGVLTSRGQQLGVDMDDVAIVPVATAMKMLNRRSLFRLLLQVRAHGDLDRARDRVATARKTSRASPRTRCSARSRPSWAPSPWPSPASPACRSPWPGSAS